MFGRNVGLSFLSVGLGAFLLAEMTDGWLWWNSSSDSESGEPKHKMVLI